MNMVSRGEKKRELYPMSTLDEFNTPNNAPYMIHTTCSAGPSNRHMELNTPNNAPYMVHTTCSAGPSNRHMELNIPNPEDVEHPDYVLVYKTDANNFYTDIFLEKLSVTKGLKVIILESRKFSKDGTVYAAIFAPRDVLMERAEHLKILCPLQLSVKTVMDAHIHDNRNAGYMPQIRDWKAKVKHWFTPDIQSGFFKIAYDRKYDVYFKNCETGDPLKSSRIRGMLVHDIIKDVDISEELRNHRSVTNMDLKLEEDEYRGIVWLQDKGHVKETIFPHCNAERKQTKKIMSRNGCAVMSITSLRNYLGEKVGFSFAWRSAWLSNALGLPIMFGIIVMLNGLIRHLTAHDKISTSPTHVKHNFTIQSVHETYVEVIDNPLAPYYALFMCCWSIFFTKMWTRFKYIYSFKWGTLQYFLCDERAVLKVTCMLRRSALKRALIMTCAIFCAILMIIFSIIYQLFMIYIQEILTEFLVDKTEKVIAEISSNIFVSLVNTLLVTFVINPFFAWASFKLTELERHHFHSDFEGSLSWRVFFNSFFNNNIRIIMMLIMPRFKLFNIFTVSEKYVEFCKKGTCVEAISYQVGFFLLVRPFSDMFQYLLYFIKRIFRISNCRKPIDGDDTLLSRIEKEYKLFRGASFGERFSVMEDMNNRVAQYGFVVMYAAAFPVAPLIAFIVEAILRKADIDRYLRTQRRVLPRRDEGVGSWVEITDFVNMVAIFTNVWIIAFRSIYGRELLIDWDKRLDEDRSNSLLALILISVLLLLTSCIRAICQYYKIPETVKLFYREESESAEKFLKAGRCSPPAGAFSHLR